MATIVFDWDGTLNKTELIYVDAFNEACDWLKEHGYIDKDRSFRPEEATCYLGMRAPDMWKSFMPDLPDDIKTYCEKIVADGMVRGIKEGRARLYDGAEVVLRELNDKEHRLLVLSNCKHDYKKALMQRFDLDSILDDFYASEDYGFMPKDEIFAGIMARDMENGFIYGTGDGPRYIMVGDRASDMALKPYGAVCVGCSYGYGTREELAAADIIIDDIRELPAVVERLTKSGM